MPILVKCKRCKRENGWTPSTESGLCGRCLRDTDRDTDRDDQGKFKKKEEEE